MEFLDIDFEATEMDKIANHRFSGLKENQIRDLVVTIYSIIDNNFWHLYQDINFEVKKSLTENINQIRDNQKNIEDLLNDDEYNYIQCLLSVSRDVMSHASYDNIEKVIKDELKDSLLEIKRLKVKDNENYTDFNGFVASSATHPSFSVALEKDYVNYLIQEKGIKIKEFLIQNIITNSIEMLILNNNTKIKNNINQYRLSIKRDNGFKIIESDESLLEEEIFNVVKKHPMFFSKKNSDKDYKEAMESYVQKNNPVSRKKLKI